MGRTDVCTSSHMRIVQAMSLLPGSIISILLCPSLHQFFFLILPPAHVKYFCRERVSSVSRSEWSREKKSCRETHRVSQAWYLSCSQESEGTMNPRESGNWWKFWRRCWLFANHELGDWRLFYLNFKGLLSRELHLHWLHELWDHSLFLKLLGLV